MKLSDLTPTQVAEHAERHGHEDDDGYRWGLWLMNFGDDQMPQFAALCLADDQTVMVSELGDCGPSETIYGDDRWSAVDEAPENPTVTAVTLSGRSADDDRDAELAALRERVAELGQRLGDEQRKYIDAEAELDHARHVVAD